MGSQVSKAVSSGLNQMNQKQFETAEPRAEEEDVFESPASSESSFSSMDSSPCTTKLHYLKVKKTNWQLKSNPSDDADIVFYDISSDDNDDDNGGAVKANEHGMPSNSRIEMVPYEIIVTSTEEDTESEASHYRDMQNAKMKVKLNKRKTPKIPKPKKKNEATAAAAASYEGANATSGKEESFDGVSQLNAENKSQNNSCIYKLQESVGHTFEISESSVTSVDKSSSKFNSLKLPFLKKSTKPIQASDKVVKVDKEISESTC